jgi:hypothetical protein
MHNGSHDIHHFVVENDLILRELVLNLDSLSLLNRTIVTEYSKQVQNVSYESNDNENNRAKNDPEAEKRQKLLGRDLDSEVDNLLHIHDRD